MTEQREKVFTSGIWYNHPHEKIKEWCFGKLSIKVADFIQWLSQQQPNNAGYINLVIKESKAGKPYMEVDFWEPKTEGQPQQQQPSPAQQNYTPQQNEISADSQNLGSDSVPF